MLGCHLREMNCKDKGDPGGIDLFEGTECVDSGHFVWVTVSKRRWRTGEKENAYYNFCFIWKNACYNSCPFRQLRFGSTELFPNDFYKVL